MLYCFDVYTISILPVYNSQLKQYPNHSDYNKYSHFHPHTTTSPTYPKYLIMQRDSYAILFKKQSKQVLPLRIIQMNGRITYERVFHESFIGYSARRIALITDYSGSGGGGAGTVSTAPKLHAVTPPAPRHPTSTATTPTTGGAVAEGIIEDQQHPSTNAQQPDIVVENFQRLAQIHRPNMRYKLLPLLCTDMSTFACLQAIVAAPNSPFKIEHRRDPVPLRIGWQNPKSPHREDVWTFFEDIMPAEERAKPREAMRRRSG